MKEKSLVVYKFGVYGLMLLFSFLITMLFSCGSYWIHEIGHVLIGLFINLVEGRFLVPHFLTYISCYFITVPQQTESIGFSWLGGPLFSIAFYSLIIFVLYKSFKLNKYIMSMPILFLIIYEIIGNVIGGTDNSLHQPLIEVSQGLIKFLAFLFLVSTFCVTSMILFKYRKIFPFFKEKLIKNNKILVKEKR